MRLKMMGGGDSTDYDALTALAEHVLEGMTFIGSGSEEEQAGTLPDMGKIQNSPGYSEEQPNIPVHYAAAVGWTVDTNGNRQIVMTPPRGGYPGNNAWVGCYPEDIGILAAVIAVGQAIAGIEGTYSSDGNLAAKDLRAGKIGYGADGRVIGTATDYGSVSKTIGAGESYTIAEGIYSAGKVTAKSLSSQTSATAIAAYILEAYTAWVNGVLVEGTMPDLNANAEITHTSSNGTKVILGDEAYLSENSDGTKRVQIRYNGDPGYLKTNTIFAVTQAVMASAIGLTAAKLATGQSVLSINGSYKGLGDATAPYVLEGKTFSSANLSNAEGTMPNLTDDAAITYTSNNSTKVIVGDAAFSGTNSDGVKRVAIRYNGDAGYIKANTLFAIPYATIASAIGLVASLLAYGKSCLDVAGTYKPTVTQLNATAIRGFGLSSSDYVSSEESSYTCTASGTCYYNGISASYNGSGTATCEIYKNGVLVDSRNIDSSNSYISRLTMVGQSFSVASGDVIKISAAASAGSHTIAEIDATIVTYT